MKGMNILVVEDENIVSMDIERSLKRLGYGVTGTVSDGDQALQLAEKKSPDLVLMDIRLKGAMDGVEIAKRMRAFNIPVVFLTAYADEPTLQRAKVAEPYGYLLKPFDEAELHTVIEVALNKHQSFEVREKETRNALELNEEIFKLFIESVRDYAIFMLDSRGLIVSWNEGAERNRGYQKSEVIGKPLSIFHTQEDLLENKAQHELKIAEIEGRYEEEGWRVRKDGTRFWAHIILTAIRDKKGRLLGFGKVSRDLTDRKRMVDDLRQSIKVKDEFLSIASHELKTPLATLKLQLQMAKRGLKMDLKDSLPAQMLDHAFATSLRQVDSLTSLVEDLLDVSRIQTGRLTLNLEPTSLNALVAEMLERFSQPLAQVQSHFEVYMEEEIVGHWDPHRIEQILVNLISNVIKYAPGVRAVLSAKKSGERVVLSVQDFGPGIPEDKQGKIFERFERAAQPRGVGGLGLGLFITKQLVNAHQGSVQVESFPGNGAKFIVDLPLKMIPERG